MTFCPACDTSRIRESSKIEVYIRAAGSASESNHRNGVTFGIRIWSMGRSFSVRANRRLEHKTEPRGLGSTCGRENRKRRHTETRPGRRRLAGRRLLVELAAQFSDSF